MMSYLSSLVWCFLILVVSVATVRIHGQPSTEDFISIDCGLADGHSYVDELTKIPYTSDAQFIEAGTNYNISRDYLSSSLPEHQRSLRSFPTGERNCYALKSLVQGQKYLLRATFMYGNYDGQNSAREDKPIQFDLHIGVNLWKSMKIVDASTVTPTEAITVALADYISVCLINKQSGTPFISSLELRPLKTSIYPAANASISLVLLKRFNMGPTDGLIRYPDDGHDRIWKPFDYSSALKEISTNLTVHSHPDDLFEAPSAVLQTALTPVNGLVLRLGWDPKREDILPECHIIMQFAEIQSLGPNDSRTFDIYLNGDPFFDTYLPIYQISDSVYTTVPYTEYEYNISLKATKNSTLPPIINGLEIYKAMHLPELSTDSRDVDAIMAIQMEYPVQKNWAGDPCVPRAYAWEGLNCSYIVSVPPRIKTLNLSSSRLSGAISSSFSKLKAIETLDLSYNNLTGTIPGFLADISSLQLLNLRGNQLTGPVPADLLRKSEEGSLILRIDGPNPCINESTCGTACNNNNKKKITTPIIMIISIGVVVLLVVVLIVWITRRRQQDFAMDSSVRRPCEDRTERNVDCKDHQLKLESRQFTYKDLENITNKFVRIIGQGGFGIVYHGFLENGVQVAVKLCSQSSSQGTKEFLAEAQSLTRVHHKNLVTFVGYCKDENYLALIYDYMSQGSLRDHLRGKADLGRILSWGERLQIAVEAAQGTITPTSSMRRVMFIALGWFFWS
ncbi:putative leucine-rich repeat receptor-like serine/threonine-protein kinase At2g19230 isoform X2 [Elaeis guineensis]|uniref:putative leucine-rich repeat receptor-like serine/threonine-protein kinase At2g19230 isoform X2 n=1 Tax=Elaeis guineensis var. tenera TaxID=51953 RepID=UPI003C6CF7D0